MDDLNAILRGRVLQRPRYEEMELLRMRRILSGVMVFNCHGVAPFGGNQRYEDAFLPWAASGPREDGEYSVLPGGPDE